ncbi:hypothetical protein [Nakamurella sp. PAMC28650]|uniref:hypothetical protein n=1 Tax=Nakamurella sp. PAMC28650 TaxID=2762325 RepID=UPI00164DB1F8|nr:hypothetical protein [Nakamurella sp. PAMC28650]QNK80978.1 hypothetical protein H7F38_23325 [Nakamurella sp. PAMC28650]
MKTHDASVSLRRTAALLKSAFRPEGFIRLAAAGYRSAQMVAPRDAEQIAVAFEKVLAW